MPNHVLSTDLNDMGKPFVDRKEQLAGRTMMVKKAQVVPIECVARGYLAGSGWKEYQKSQTVCGIPLPAGLQQASPLPAPIFTPATKAETGHDENISYEVMAKAVGEKLANTLKQSTLDIYSKAAAYAQSKGIILADTKFEFGTQTGGRSRPGTPSHHPSWVPAGGRRRRPKPSAGIASNSQQQQVLAFRRPGVNAARFCPPSTSAFDVRRGEQCALGPVPPPVPPGAPSGAANQGCEMEVPMGRHVALQAPISASHAVGQRGRRGGVQHAIAIALPGPVERRDTGTR